MSAVELAVRKVKQLSDGQARELLNWLAQRQRKTTVAKRQSPATRRKAKARRAMRELMEWYDSVRGKTNWQPPRMPDDLVKPIRL